MDLRTEPAGKLARVLALFSLIMGLGDAARLGGFGSGSASPVTELGTTGFTLLAIFCLMRLFAAVGLWVRTRWGAVLLASATGVEIALYLSGSAWVSIGLIGFVIKLVVFLATIGLLLLARHFALRQVTD